ncbi:hypothetical protein CCS01_10170 [Rhodopila globiformis]|uniref:Uncharacterized protein n=1 Tax=Rhodopila globiformis TaxID=1071 RepID=A0A2S6NIW7_RHOGL|nr:hypothetical protein CCS01_10170 [Rhodopila globiformis]
MAVAPWARAAPAQPRLKAATPARTRVFVETRRLYNVRGMISSRLLQMKFLCFRLVSLLMEP